jgi:hypothetical protein
MPALRYNGTINVIHSNYYYKTINSNPVAQMVYWNVIDQDNDIIPVTTYGYKNYTIAERKIKEYVLNVKEIVFLHEETEEEYEQYSRHLRKVCVWV